VSEKFCLFGDMRLWREARYPTPAAPQRGHAIQTHLGLDQKRALLVGRSENLVRNLSVCTFGRPHPTYYNQEAWISLKRKIERTFAGRMGAPSDLCWIADSSKGGVLVGGAGQVLDFGAVAHGLAIGDVLVVVHATTPETPGVAPYVIRTVQSVPTAFVVHVSANVAPFALVAGDRAWRVSSRWTDVWAVGMQPVAVRPGKGDYFAEELHFDFMADDVTTYDRIASSLDV
jgi:hypothetical protein